MQRSSSLATRARFAALAFALALALAVPARAGQTLADRGPSRQPAGPSSKEAVAPANPRWSGGFSIGLDSDYVTEGWNQVPGAEGAFSVEGTVSFGGFTGGVWYLDSIGARYEELNLFIEYSRDVGPVTLSAGYTYLYFPADHAHTHEIAAGIELPLFDGKLAPFANLVEDVRAPGAGLWAEVGLQSELTFLDDRLSIAPYALLGIDLGYVSQETDDVNNVEIGLEISWKLIEQVRLFAHVHQSWALENLERECLGDIAWGGIGLAVEF